MKKSAGIVIGAAVAVAVVSTAGAWYTGKQLPSELDTSIKEANAQLQQASLSLGVNTRAELVSLEQGLFSSTARYRLVIGESELLFVDRIDHGPFPLNRLKRFELAPVMAASTYELAPSPLVQGWFDAAKGASPLVGSAAIGYDRSVSGSLELKPLDTQLDEKTHLAFSGLRLDLRSSAGGERVAAVGSMDSLRFDSTSDSGQPVQVEVKGLSLDSDQSRTESGLYVGKSDMVLKTTRILIDGEPTVTLDDLSQRQDTRANGSKIEGSQTFAAGFRYKDKPVGSTEMVWSVKNIDAVALKSLLELYASVVEQTGAEPNLDALDEAQQKQAQADLERILDAKPAIALDKLSFKTANGESRLSLGVQLAKPSSFEQSPDQVAREIVTGLDMELSLSKPMISDIVSLKAALDGEEDQELIAQQASMTTEMASGMLLSTNLVALEGETIRSSLHYADGQVDFNGKKMTVEEFAGMAMAMAGGLGGALGAQPEMGGMEGMEEGMEGMGEGEAEEAAPKQ
ncbi:YdgA family protein [Metapseudomonas otitidis]|uniref:YdgA family protein n=1 Tax=Metapseudomonas otitidis TaxID=319939 RepID=UPI0013F69863|nr:YdgA family protein [Pseudomonas otitidis]